MLFFKHILLFNFTYQLVSFCIEIIIFYLLREDLAVLYDLDFFLRDFFALLSAFLLLVTRDWMRLMALFLARLSLDLGEVFLSPRLDLARALLAEVKDLDALRTADLAALSEEELVLIVRLQVFPDLDLRDLAGQCLDEGRLRKVFLRLRRLTLRDFFDFFDFLDLRDFLDFFDFLDLLADFFTLLEEVSLAEADFFPALKEIRYLETRPLRYR